MLIKKLLAKNFAVLPDTLSPTDACSRITEDEMAVVVDVNGTPHSLATAEDIRTTARLGAATLCEPGVKLPRTITVRRKSDSLELSADQLRWLTDASARGVVVLDDAERVAGVITCAMLYSNMDAATFSRLTVSTPAATLGGDPTTGPARIMCLKCLYVNGVHYFDDNHPPRCQNEERTPHTIVF